jgi:hypothetical protein
MFARQADFDAIVAELIINGSNLEDSVLETSDQFRNSNLDLSNLFIYSKASEYEDKLKIENYCRSMERAALHNESIVNMSFSINGLMSIIRKNNSISVGAIRIIESRKIFSTIIQILIQMNSSNNEEFDADSNGENDDDSDDEDENRILQRIILFDFLLFLMERANLFNNYHSVIAVNAEQVVGFCKIFDDEMGDHR